MYNHVSGTVLALVLTTLPYLGEGVAVHLWRELKSTTYQILAPTRGLISLPRLPRVSLHSGLVALTMSSKIVAAVH